MSFYNENKNYYPSYDKNNDNYQVFSIRKETIKLKDGIDVLAELYSKGRFTYLSYRFKNDSSEYKDKNEIIKYLNDNGMKIDKTRFEDDEILLNIGDSIELTIVVGEEY